MLGGGTPLYLERKGVWGKVASPSIMIGAIRPTTHIIPLHTQDMGTLTHTKLRRIHLPTRLPIPLLTAQPKAVEGVWGTAPVLSPGILSQKGGFFCQKCLVHMHLAPQGTHGPLPPTSYTGVTFGCACMLSY